MTHPARFTPAIVETLEPLIRQFNLPVHDPFAGTGERLGALCDKVGVPFTGTEIEPEFIVDPRVQAGDSTDWVTYPYHEGLIIDYLVVTSPVYPNGMTDHFHAKDSSRRHTYRQRLAEILGHDRPLHPNNMGRYGNQFRRGLTNEATHFKIARHCIQHWPNQAIVNVKDVIAKDYTVLVIDRWRNLMYDAGYGAVCELNVNVPSQRHGANAELRAETERVIVFRR
jgi:hypothetical protein